jgi:hypothetical protein
MRRRSRVEARVQQRARIVLLAAQGWQSFVPNAIPDSVVLLQRASLSWTNGIAYSRPIIPRAKR